VQALAPEHQPRLLIAGSGELTGMVTEASQQYGSIQYRGPLSHADSLAMVARSDALVCPSIWYEGMPMTILEAFSLGKPVIASSIGALPEMVEHEKNGWVFLAGSSSSLEACIHDASTNRERPAEYGKNAIKKWRRCYSEEVNFELLMKIYRTYI
jgi:glycosyltransferase involved in cell wall biosynthesis